MNKKSRKAKKFYNLKNAAGNPVKIDLNNYKVQCTVTGVRKGFYHAYLAGLIERDYDNNIDTFRTTYVSREGRKELNDAKKIQKVKDRISNLYNQIRELKATRDQLQADFQTIS